MKDCTRAIKADRRAIAEWLIGYCSERSHRYYGTHMRRKCNACMITAGVALRKGEVPGPTGVLTTEYRPRGGGRP